MTKDRFNQKLQSSEGRQNGTVKQLVEPNRKLWYARK